MKNIAALSLCAMAGSAFANPVLENIDRSDYVIYGAESYSAVALDTPVISNRGTAGDVIYSNMDTGPDGFVAFAANAVVLDGAQEILGTDFYTSTASGDTTLTAMRFVGGVQQAGGVAFFDFFDAGGVAVGGFGIAFADAGNFIYDLTIGSAPLVADAGFVQMSVDDDGLFGTGVQTTGQWFLGNGGATVGANGAPVTGDFNHNFELTTIPAPGAIALMGMGGLLAARRRR